MQPSVRINEQHAAATIYALASDAVFLRLTDGYGWSARRLLSQKSQHTVFAPTDAAFGSRRR